MSPESLRLFIAVDLPQAARDALTQLQKQLQGLDRSHAMRWSAINGVHLTLKFLGDAPADQVRSIETALNEAVQGIAPFDLNIEDAGCFPDTRKPRVLWAGCSGDLATLHDLRDSVERTVAPLGFPTEDRPFSPHLTLGRARQEAARDGLAVIGSAVAHLRIGIIASWPVHAVTLFRSDLNPGGAVYTALASARLDE